jgi:DNA-binding NarL/FixJ family response regulator
MLRILIADDHSIVRLAIRSVIEAHRGWVVIGEACDGEEAFELAVNQKPDIAIVDVEMPSSNGIVLTQRLHRHCPKVKVVLFTAHHDRRTVSAGLGAGARGFIPKDGDLREIERAVSALSRNCTYFSPRISDTLLDLALGKNNVAVVRFTPQELRVAQLISEGNSSKQIARLLDISVKTVESHRSAAMRKAGCRRSPDLVRYVLKNKLIQA